MQWVITEELVPKDDLETCHPDFDPLWREMSSPPWYNFGHVGIIWIGNRRTMHSQRILHAPGDISVHGRGSPGKLRTQALQSGGECSVDYANISEKCNR